MSEPSSDQPETAKRGLGCTDVVMRLRYWFLDTFGERWSEKAYIGHGDFTEINGWMFRGQFYPFDIDDAA